MGKTVRAWQKRCPNWKNGHREDRRKKHFGQKKDRFRFDPRDY